MENTERCELCLGTEFEEFIIVVDKSKKTYGVYHHSYKERNYLIEKTIKECLVCHDRKLIKKEEIDIEWKPKPKINCKSKKTDVNRYGLID